MIIEMTMHGAVCDNCGKHWNSYEGHIAYTDKASINEAVGDSDWYVEGLKHYCDDCFCGYDDDDKIIIKKMI